MDTFEPLVSTTDETGGLYEISWNESQFSNPFQLDALRQPCNDSRKWKVDEARRNGYSIGSQHFRVGEQLACKLDGFSSAVFPLDRSTLVVNHNDSAVWALQKKVYRTRPFVSLSSCSND